MEKSEIQILKEEMEKIMPEGIIQSSKLVSDYLNASVENFKRVVNMVSLIHEKAIKAKKVIETDLDELADKRTKMIEENNTFFNDRTEKSLALDKEILRKESEIGGLEKTFEACSDKVNTISKNIVGLMFEKDNLSKEMETLSAGTSAMRSNQIDLMNQVKIAESKKDEAHKELSVVLGEIDEAKIRLQSINNEILIKSSK